MTLKLFRPIFRKSLLRNSSLKDPFSLTVMLCALFVVKRGHWPEQPLLIDKFMASDLGEEMDTETGISGCIRNLLPREGSVNAYGEIQVVCFAYVFQTIFENVFCTLYFKHGPLTNCLYLYAVLFMQNYLQSEENSTKRRLPLQVCWHKCSSRFWSLW